MLKEIDLAPYQLRRPSRIRWYFPQPDKDHELLEYIRSKDLRKGLKDHEGIIKNNKITWDFRPLLSTEFGDWVNYYKEQMTTLGHDILASEERINAFVNEGRNVFTFDVFKEDELVGRKLITLKDGIANSCFKASRHIPRPAKKISLGVLIDYLMIIILNERNDVLKISFGSSVNTFAPHNKRIGYLSYKFQFGQLPEIGTKAEFLDKVELGEGGYVFFYALDEEDDLKLYSIKPKKPDENYEMIKKIAPEGVIELEVND